MSMSRDITKILEQIRRPTDVVPLCLRGDLIAEWKRLEQAFRDASTTIDDDVTASGRSATAAKLAREMEALREQMQAATEVFTLQASRRPEWLAMYASHKPDDGDEAGKEAFAVAIVAAAATDPVMTPAQAEELRDELTDGQWEVVVKTVMALNRTSPGVPYSQAAAYQAALPE
jgi:hypothetical protein